MICCIGDKRAWAIYIGHVLSSVHFLLSDLQRGNPDELRVLQVIDGGKGAESEIRGDLSRYSCRDGGAGWFYLRRGSSAIIDRYFPSAIVAMENLDRPYHLIRRKRKNRHTFVIAVPDYSVPNIKRGYRHMHALNTSSLHEARARADEYYRAWSEKEGLL